MPFSSHNDLLISQPLDHIMRFYNLKQFSLPEDLLGISLTHIDIPPFSFQDYQQIVNTVFLKAEMQKILSLSEHQASELHNSNSESLDGKAFFPINSWPEDVENLFYKFETGDNDTFKFILFAFGNNMSPHLLLNFLLIKYIP